MIRGVLEMSDQTVRELMTPRTDVTAVSTEASFGDVMRLVSSPASAASRSTRSPWTASWA
ncbi:MAG: hypothetical protein H6674_09070 [Dehalococcoidia bacterium]|nr:hypothetical protein [Dehalococcoidia bacterium]